MKLSPRRCVSNEEELVHRTPARNGHLSRPLAGRETTLPESRQKKKAVPEAGHRTQHPEPYGQDLAFYLKSSEKFMKMTLGGQ